MNIFSPLFIFLIIQLSTLLANQGKCLENCTSDFVAHLKRVEIPGHPHAFNPSLIRWNGALLMSFREVVKVEDVKVSCAAESIVGIVMLDENYAPLGKPFIIDFETSPSRPEDARLVKVGADIFMLYSDNTDEIVTDSGFRMWMAKLVFEEGKFMLKDKERLTYFDCEQATRREKNWVPFDYQGNLCLAYSLIPHRIFLPIPNTECCYDLCSTDTYFDWRWGEPRGGTPAIQIGGHYLSFFHSSIEISTMHSEGEKVPHYFIGAYLFSAAPPFEITHVSKKPIIAKGFYSGFSYIPYWKPIQAVFPCGILVEKNEVIMTYGRQDHELWIAVMNRRELLRSLEPLSICEAPAH